MKRNQWISLLCGGLLLLAATAPAAAADREAMPRVAVLEWVMEWIVELLPAAGLENHASAGKDGGTDPRTPPMAPACELCTEGESSVYIDPDG